jgi:hypothetical protein
VTAPAIAITGQLVDIHNVATHKCARLTVHVPAEQAASIVAAFGWPTMVDPVPIAIARLTNPPAAETSPHGGQEGKRGPADIAPAPPPNFREMRGKTETAVVQPEAPKPERKWREVPLSQQAAIRCGEPLFRKYLEARYHGCYNTDDAAAEKVRHLCRVASRSEISIGDFSGKVWAIIDDDFRAWKLAPQVGA